MNHLYPNFFITHEREGKWHELQPGRSIEKCLSGTCPGYCKLSAAGDFLATRGDQHVTKATDDTVQLRPYCAWLVPLEGEPLGHFQMVEGGVGEIGRVYNPYVFRSHLPSAQDGHPLARAYAPEKHALLSEFYRRGHKASYHYAKDDAPFEDELGREEQAAAMAIYHQHTEWTPVFAELAKDFLWSFSTMALISPLLQPNEGGAGTAPVEATPVGAVTQRAALLSPSAHARAITTTALESCPQYQPLAFTSTEGGALMKPIAWLHNAGRYDVIHDEVKNLWLRTRPEHVEHYTIPLFREEGTSPDQAEVGAVKEAPLAWLDVSHNIGGHNGEYDWKCQVCGYTTWFSRSTDPNKEGIGCPNCEKEKAK